MVTVALRTCEGLNLSLLSEQYRKYCLKNAKRFIDDGLLAIDNQQLHLTRKGLFVSDMVMSELMMVD
jgi:oxygen-independent coproporphyrinogen-3 oxidase